MRVLGIETSCDETAAAVIVGEESEKKYGFKLLSNVIRAQVMMHSEYGGVVPELASRAHMSHILPVIEEALRLAQIDIQDLDGVAVTSGPGLVGALLVGIAVAKGVAFSLGCPIIGVHHMEGHLMSPFLAPEADHVAIEFPFVALLVSGGHTLLLYAHRFGVYELLGATRDDAVGEAFDKGARMLGLGYPGGPAIATLAKEGRVDAVAFPRVLLDRKQFDFSFSGLKTALRSFLAQNPIGMADQSHLADVAASYQEAIVDTLVFKALAACRKTGVKALLVAGGVGANQRLQEKMGVGAKKIGVKAIFPALSHCTDNGAMIALAGWRRLRMGQQSDWEALNARPRWPVSEIGPG
ncbi:MAG: tRNA (adenosine(37)-N6)-threonylcarbamoyltransferase complex transferase subunit TsaD [Magnetococcus sp. DMHC-6]